jgi:tetraacyldisaccharide 4'-kinase
MLRPLLYGIVLTVFVLTGSFLYVLKGTMSKEIFEVLLLLDKRYLFLSVLSMFFYHTFDNIRLFILARAMHLRYSFFYGYLVSFINTFGATITPAHVGGEMMSLYTLSRKGGRLHKVMSVVVMKTLTGMVFFVFMLPFLVYYFYKHTQYAIKLFVILVVLGLLSLLAYKVLKYLFDRSKNENQSLILRVKYTAVSLRNWLYDRGFLKTCSFSVPILCVGNLSVGGSGKTSLVRFLAQNLAEDYHTAVLLRGYKRSTKGPVVVSYRGEVRASWKEVGDEAYMLANLLKNVSVVVSEDRCLGAKLAVEELKAQLIILDDGFQHRRLKRDLDIVLLKEKDLKDRLLPFGRLREPLDGLKRAHAAVLTYQDIKEWEFKIEKPTFKLYRKNWRVVSRNGEVLDFKDKSFIAFCGLGDNEQFFKTLERLGIKTEERLSFPDHYHYEGFKLQKGKLYITTLKDFFKLEPAENLYYLDFDVEVPGLMDFVRERLTEKP